MRPQAHPRDLFGDGCAMRGSQAKHLAAIQDGQDAILIAATTGSGKTKTMFAPAKVHR